MIDPKPAIPKWASGVLRTVGTVNAVLALIGTSFVVDSIYRFSTDKYPGAPDAPYFRLAFVVMLAIETVFLAILTVMAVRLMRARLSAINSYSLWVLAVIVYNLAIVMLWRPGAVGFSVAAATAITTDGIGELQLCFQVPSVILLQVLRRRYSAQRNRMTAFAPSPRIVLDVLSPLTRTLATISMPAPYKNSTNESVTSAPALFTIRIAWRSTFFIRPSR